ncbi:MAG: NUDIX hydrolase [Candidatus Heteroscillospira sp.]|jgi:8-oxo-dGTP pyrophosphatase MutT (NUDIX family)
MSEMVNIFDENQQLIGSAERSEAHRLGLMHDVVHCWVVDPRGEGRVYFQQRSRSKATFPLYYDIAVGGHIQAGEPPEKAALREIKEEIGLELHSWELCYCGSLRKSDYFSEGLDREIGRVFLFTRPAPCFEPGDELERMVSISLPEYLRRFQLPFVSARTEDGLGLEIYPENWAGTMSREFEDIVLPHIRLLPDDKSEFYGSCSMFSTGDDVRPC